MRYMRHILGACAALLLSASGASADAEKAGDVVSLTGKAVVERQEQRIQAARKTVLLESDNVITRKNSRLKMLFRDDSVLTLGSSSRLVIKKYLYSPESKRAESIYELADGKLRAVVGNADFKVTTPTAFSAARGTIFVMWFDAALNSTGILVIEGELLVRNINEAITETQTLRAGQVTYVPFDGPPSPPMLYTGRSDADGQAAPDDVVSESSVISLPDPVMPGPSPILDIGLGVGVAPIAPPIQQTPGSNVTNVNLNLIFQ